MKYSAMSTYYHSSMHKMHFTCAMERCVFQSNRNTVSLHAASEENCKDNIRYTSMYYIKKHQITDTHKVNVNN